MLNKLRNLKKGGTHEHARGVNDLKEFDKLFGSDRPGQFDTGDRERFARIAHSDRSFPHAGQGGDTRVRPVKCDVLVDFVRYAKHVVLLAQRGHLFQLIAAVHFAQRIVGRVYDDALGFGRECGLQLRVVPAPVGRRGDLILLLLALHSQRHEHTLGAIYFAHRSVAVIERLDDDDLVARVAQAAQRIVQALIGANRDYDLV